MLYVWPCSCTGRGSLYIYVPTFAIGCLFLGLPNPFPKFKKHNPKGDNLLWLERKTK